MPEPETIPIELKDQWRREFIAQFKTCLNDPTQMVAAVNSRAAIQLDGVIHNTFNVDSLNTAFQAIADGNESHYQPIPLQAIRINTELLNTGLSQIAINRLTTVEKIKYSSTIWHAIDVPTRTYTENLMHIDDTGELTQDLSRFKKELSQIAKPLIEEDLKLQKQKTLEAPYNQARTELLTTIKACETRLNEIATMEPLGQTISETDLAEITVMKSLGESILTKTDAYKDTNKAELRDLTSLLQTTQQEIIQVTTRPGNEQNPDIIHSCAEKYKTLDVLLKQEPAKTGTLKERLHKITTPTSASSSDTSDASDKADYRRYVSKK